MAMSEPLPIGVVGGGIVGLAVARALTRRFPGVAVHLFEKEAELATHQTGHNSGVVHAGIYYAPASLKAQLCARGRTLLREFCAEHDLAYDECGKLVVATSPDELGRLDELERRATVNGVPGLCRLDGPRIEEIEPHAAGVAALHSPETAITDFRAVAATFAAEVRAAGGVIDCATAVTGIVERGDAVEVTTSGGVTRVRRLVVCAGLQSDRVGPVERDVRIVPFRGEYLEVVGAKRALVRGLIYPVPDPRYPFLGVHFTRQVDGTLDIGPNALLGLSREGYRRWSMNARDVADIVAFAGFWRFARQHWRTGAGELWRSLSTRAYLAAAQRYVPAIGFDDVRRGTCGIRAQALDRDGRQLDDFRLDRSGAVLAVRNAPSPAATSSLAIAEHIVDTLTR